MTANSRASAREAVSVVGDREGVIAGTDCGFGTFAGHE
jgi:5-methyltetrahydropteroyltriglutamate--homocysteine methyltransferase